MRSSLITRLLLMTMPVPPLNASGSDLQEELLLADFSESSVDLRWYVVNDNVMGGQSTGEFSLEEDELLFTGDTNTNGGGFSSIRTGPMRLDLSTHTGIRLYLQGDGRRYTWRLTTSARHRGRQVTYWAHFETRNGEWLPVDIPFSDFVPRFRGFRLDGPVLDSSQITSMGLMIYDKQDGPFELRISSVRAYVQEAQ